MSVRGDGQGNLYVTDIGDHTVRKIAISTGAVTLVAGKAGMPGNADGTGSAAEFRYPYGIASDRQGNLLFVADTINSRVRKIVIATQEVSTFIAGPDKPYGIAYDSSGKLFVASPDLSLIVRIDVLSQQVETFVGERRRAGVCLGPLPARLARPVGVVVQPSGQIAITDNQAYVVLRVE